MNGRILELEATVNELKRQQEEQQKKLTKIEGFSPDDRWMKHAHGDY